MLLLLPAATFIAAAGLAAAHALVDNQAVRSVVQAVRTMIPSGAGLALLATWFGLTALYATADRAGLYLGSCAVGAAVATLLLVGVLWAFVRFQIGAARAGAVHAGLSAGPVLLLLVYFSWYVTLVGAEVAVGNDVDRTLARGACTWRLDGVGPIVGRGGGDGGCRARNFARDAAGGSDAARAPKTSRARSGCFRRWWTRCAGCWLRAGCWSKQSLDNTVSIGRQRTLPSRRSSTPSTAIRSLDVSRDRSGQHCCARARGAAAACISTDEMTLDRLALP